MTAIAPVITIDGPSGAGKGTLCKAMAEALQWHLLDSGAIYRVLALAALHHHVAVASEEALVPLPAVSGKRRGLSPTAAAWEPWYSPMRQ